MKSARRITYQQALVLIHQADFLLRRLLEKHKQDFLENGGIKEQMSAARRNWREEHGMGYLNGSYGKNEKNGNNSRRRLEIE